MAIFGCAKRMACIDAVRAMYAAVAIFMCVFPYVERSLFWWTMVCICRRVIHNVHGVGHAVCVSQLCYNGISLMLGGSAILRSVRRAERSKPVPP